MWELGISEGFKGLGFRVSLARNRGSEGSE